MRIGDGSEIKITESVRVTGSGALTANVLQVTGTVRIISQYAVLTSVTTLTNATAVYADAYDGTNTTLLTADGAVLSNFVEGSFFTKDQDVTQTYSALDASQVRVNEIIDTKKAGKPFIVVQKKDTDTFIRFHLTTTDNPVDFTMRVTFCYEPLSPGASLVFV